MILIEIILESSIAILEKKVKIMCSSELYNFFNINPSKHCLHHCVLNRKNEMIHEYCQVDPVHKAFV